MKPLRLLNRAVSALTLLIVGFILLNAFGVRLFKLPNPRDELWAFAESLRGAEPEKALAGVAALEARMGPPKREDGYGDLRYRAQMLRADALLRLGRAQAAVRAFEAAKRLDYGGWEARFGLGRALAMQPDGCEGALRELDGALPKRSGEFYDKNEFMPEFYRLRAECRAVKGEYEGALEDLAAEIGYRKAARTDPRALAEARGLRALYWVSAYRLLDHVIESGYGYGYPRAMHLQGPTKEQHLRRWRDEFRQRALETVRVPVPDPAGPQRLALARSLALAGKHDEARDALDRAAQDPEVRTLPEYWIAKAESDEKTHGKRFALKSLEQALLLRPNHREAEYYKKRLTQPRR